MKHFQHHFIVALILNCLFVSASHAEQTEGEQSNAAVIPSVTVSKATMTDIVERIAISGTLIAKEEVYINTRINGYAIERLDVTDGDRIKKGDVVVVLDDDNLQLQVMQAEADLARSEAAIAQAQSQITASQAANQEARETLVRNTRLRRSGHISQQDLDKAIASSNTTKANVRSAESGLKISRAQSKQVSFQLRSAKNNLANAVIHSPVSGIISECAARLGEIASAGGEPLCKIIKDGVVEMEAEVIETALGKVRVGQTVTLNIPGVGELQGSVRLISPTVDSRTRLAKVKIQLPNSSALRPGLSGSGWILENKRRTLTVPASAVTTEDGKTVVSVVKDGVIEKREVTPGSLSMDGRREVATGLTLGETIITKAGVFYRAGDKVKTLSAPEAAE